MSQVRHKRVLASLCVGAAIFVFPLAAPGGAAGGAKCGKLASKPPVTVNGAPTIKGNLSKCTPTTATGGSAKFVANLKTSTGKATWANHKGTTTLTMKYAPGPTPNKCPKGTTLFVAKGKVTGGTGAAAKVIKKGQAIKASICVNNTKFNGSLMPGTSFIF
jgi:hypothetical protein